MREEALARREPKPEVTVANVKKYVTAEMSLQLYGAVPDKVYEQRKAECMGCEHRFKSNEIEDEIGFCRACGCGVTSRARLTIKLTMPESTCPKEKWKPSHGRHATLRDRVKSWLLKRIIG